MLVQTQQKKTVNCVIEMLDNESGVVCPLQVLVTFKTRKPGILDAKPRFYFVVSLFCDDFCFEVCNLLTDRCINCVCITFLDEMLGRV